MTKKMIHIPELEFRLSSSDYPNSLIESDLVLRIQPTNSHQDVKSISYVFTVGEDTYTGNVDTDILESMSTHFDLDIEDEIWNTDTIVDVSLAIQLDRLIATLTPEEITSVASPYTTIWNAEYPNTDEEVRQAFVNVFLAECSLYMVVCDLLWSHNAWSLFPFSWELPYDDLDTRIMTYSCIKYMTYPVIACGVVANGITKPISWLLESFNNSFGIDYTEGEKLSLTKLSKEITVEVAKYNTVQATIQRQEIENQLKKVISQINSEYVEKQQYILQSLSEIQQEQSKILSKLEELESLSKIKIDTLEREVGDLNVNAQHAQPTKNEDESSPGVILELSADVQQLTERVLVLESQILSKKN